MLLHDAFLLPDEVAAEAFFGHAAVDYAIGLGQRAGARRVLLTHHKPGRTDDALDRLARRVAAGRWPAGRQVQRRGGVAGAGRGAGRALTEVILAAEGETLSSTARRDRGRLRAERAGRGR